MATITINNTVFTGNNIRVENGNVIIDGEDVTPDSKEIHIAVQGDVESIDVGVCREFEVIGNVGKVRTGSGDLKCGNVTGDVQTGSGNVDCWSIGGSVQTGSGDVSAENISGSVKTGSGDITYRK